MTTARVRTLQIRPFQSADVGFDSAGVIAAQDFSSAALGKRVVGVDFAPLAGQLGEVDKAAPGRLVATSTELRKKAVPQALFSLRNDGLETHLEQLLVSRELAYHTRYRHKKAIATAVKETFPVDAGKLKHLKDLVALSASQKDALNAAYTADGVSGVVKNIKTKSKNTGTTTTATKIAPIALSNTAHTIAVASPAGNSSHAVGENKVIPHIFKAGWQELQSAGVDFESQRSVATNDLEDVIETVGYDYRHPSLEASLAHVRAQVDADDDLFGTTLQALKLQDVERSLDLELAAMDLEIRRAQLRLLHTYLLPPISGLVTAIYHDVGEYVEAGEPVVRIENDQHLLLVGWLQHRSPLTVGRQVIIRTTPYDTSRVVELQGTLVSVRGHEEDDDEWDLVIDVPKASELPLNYHFDRDATTVAIA